MEFFRKLFNSDFMPHGHCYLWKPEIVWTNALSDGIIALAYFTIPLSLIYIVRLRKDFKYYWMVILFAVFILGCGATHIMDVINIWEPIYRLDSLLRVVTAIASIGTAITLVKLTPSILLIPDVNIFKEMNEKLTLSNKQLEDSYEELAVREEELRILNLRLEERIEERTKALQESEERFRTLADNIPNLAWMANGDGYITWYNKRWYEYTGTSSEQMEGLGWQAVHDPKELPVVVERWAESIRSGKPFEMVFPLKGANGKFTPFLTRVMPIRDEAGNITRWFGTNTDITHQIENEAVLEKKNKELAKTNADLDNFIYISSHDLKAPVANIEGLINTIAQILAEKNKKDDEIDTLIAMIKTSVERFQVTIKDLTEISKVQKNVQNDFEDINTADAIKQVELDIADVINKNEATITINTESCPSVYFSKTNFRSILYNLLSNAVKYRSPERLPQVAVTCYANNNFYVLEVKDNGIGLKEEQKDKIFGMFKRFNVDVEGTGVGLYIVKRIVENAEGKIEVESEAGKGSTFRIYLKNIARK